MQKNTYAIIGATGHTGNTVASKLIEQGQAVRAIGRSADRLASLVQRGAEAVIAELEDSAALARAFAGARGVYVMIPPTLAEPDYRAFQDRVGASVAAALEQSRVPYVVTLSSFGADKESGTGPVAGLHELEQRINSIPGVNVLHLRAGYFMENLMPQVRVIQQFKIVAGPLRADLNVPMIATHDIGAVAAERLLMLNFSGQQTQELLGERDLTMAEAASIVGKTIGRTELNYVQLPDEQVRTFFIQAGFAPRSADLFLEMAAAMNSGHMRALELRSAANTTPTSFEKFLEQVFVPAYKGASKAA